MRSLERKGLDMLLELFPEADVVAVNEAGPLLRDAVGGGVTVVAPPAPSWTTVRLTMLDGEFQQALFAIWKHTGAVYRMDADAVHDDPFLVPEGSSYTGPREEWP